jgi:hypothetical protein
MMSLLTPSAYVQVFNITTHLSICFILETAGSISMGSDTGHQHSKRPSQFYFALNVTVLHKRPTQSPTRWVPGALSAVLNGRSSSYAGKSTPALAVMAWLLSKDKNNKTSPLPNTGRLH